MHDAYESFPILEKLPLRIECIACYGKFHIELESDLLSYLNLKTELSLATCDLVEKV